MTITCDNSLFAASLAQLVSSRPRDSSETFLLGRFFSYLIVKLLVLLFQFIQFFLFRDSAQDLKYLIFVVLYGQLEKEKFKTAKMLVSSLPSVTANSQ